MFEFQDQYNESKINSKYVHLPGRGRQQAKVVKRVLTKKSLRSSVRAQLTFSVDLVARSWTFSLGIAKLHSENK
jgi:hypothetical protein